MSVYILGVINHNWNGINPFILNAAFLYPLKTSENFGYYRNSKKFPEIISVQENLFFIKQNKWAISFMAKKLTKTQKLRFQKLKSKNTNCYSHPCPFGTTNITLKLLNL